MKKTISTILILSLLTLQLTTLAGAFFDVGESHWAKDAIDSFSERGIVVGKDSNTFAPEDNVTREEFAKIMTLTFGLELKEPALSQFSDVKSDRWSVPYIYGSIDYVIPVFEIHERELVYSSLRYGPEYAATRMEIAVAIAKILGYKGEGTGNVDFADKDKIPGKYLSYIAYASEMGIIKGYDDGTFRPFDSVTRAEAVAMLYRAEKLPKPTLEPTPTQPVNPTPTPSVTPTLTPSASPTGIPKPPTGNKAAVIRNISKVSVDGEVCSKITIAYDGKIAADPLYTDTDVRVIGRKTSVDALKPGDIFLFGYSMNGKITTIYVMLSVDEAKQNLGGINHLNMLSLAKGTNYGDYGLYGSGAKMNLYYGRITKVRTGNNGKIVTVNGNDNNEQTAYIPETLSFLRIKEYISSDSKYSSATANDLSIGVDQTFLFVRVLDDDVIDAVMIDYK